MTSLLRSGLVVLIPVAIACPVVFAESPVDVGDRRELFVDRHLIGTLKGEARRQLHRPVPEGVAITFDEPWEGNVSGYHSVFRDGDRYRMYYRGWQLELRENGHRTVHEPVLCYAESDDGIHWDKPDLGQFSFNGSRDNNIVLTKDAFGQLNDDPGHAAVFRDNNPDAAGNARYKAIVRSRDPSGLLAFRSPDGIHWTPTCIRFVLNEFLPGELTV